MNRKLDTECDEFKCNWKIEVTVETEEDKERFVIKFLEALNSLRQQDNGQ